MDESATNLPTSVGRLTAPRQGELLQETLVGTIATGHAANGNRIFVVDMSKVDLAELS